MLIALSVAIISIGAILFFGRRLLRYLRHFQEFDYSKSQFKDWILENGSGADRQLRVFEASGGDLKKVVDYICEETEYGLPTQAPLTPMAN